MDENGHMVAVIWGYVLVPPQEFTIKLKGDFTILELQKILGSLTKTQGITITKEG